MTFIPVSFMRMCWTHPVFSYYSGGICKDFHVYAFSVCVPRGGVLLMQEQQNGGRGWI